MVIGETCFDLDRQMHFAGLSGDYNPIHVDSIAVRRTLPGRLVVHGVHVLLWALETVGRSRCQDLHYIARIRVRFLRFTHVGDDVRLIVAARNDNEMRLHVMSANVVRADIRISFGTAANALTRMETGFTFGPGVGPLDHRAVAMDGQYGSLSPMAPGNLSADFPIVATSIGAQRINALAAASRLVGMIFPGLHSILGGLDVNMTADDRADALAFEMGELRHGQIDAAIAGGGIAGNLDCRVPNAPVTQPSSATLRSLVPPGCFNSTRVLIVGGSRGLGEVAAKLLALGGANVMITYNTGQSDAMQVAADIEQAGGACAVQHYDATKPARDQIGSCAPTHACWLATPIMARTDTSLLDEIRLAECQSVLVSGFFAFVAMLHSRHGGLPIFYPSSQLIDAPPPGLGEFLMARATAEVLTRSIETTFPRMKILAPRLPPMQTDQTARMGIEAAPVAEILLSYLNDLVCGN